MTNFQMVKGDLKPSILVTLQYSDGSAVNLTGCTVKFRMSQQGVTIIDEAAVIVTPPTAGVVRYDWTAGKTNLVGLCEAEFQVTYADSTTQTFPTTEDFFIEFLDRAITLLGDLWTDLDTVRRRVGLATADILDADVTKYIVEALEFLSDQTGHEIDTVNYTEAEAEAIRNLAAIKCFFDVTGTSSTGWTANIGPITFSGAPDKIAMINWLWSRVQDFIRRRSGSATGAATSGTFKVGAANY